MQVRAVDDAQLGDGIHRVDAHPAAVGATLPAGQLGGLCGADRPEVRTEAERIEGAQPIAEDRQARPMRTQVGGLFDDRHLGAGREADVLVTQFPLPAAWLRADLTFRQVSRPFLELLGLSDAQVLGRALPELLPGMPALAARLAGRSGR